MTHITTYSFEEAIARVGQCTERWELKTLAEVLESEKRLYSVYHLKLIAEAIRIMNDVVCD